MNPAWFAAIAAGIAALASLIRAIWEPTRLEVAHIALPGCSPLPEEQKEDGQTDTLRLVLLTDLHIDRMRIPEKRLMTALERLQPDLVLFAAICPAVKNANRTRRDWLGPDHGIAEPFESPACRCPGQSRQRGRPWPFCSSSGVRVASQPGLCPPGPRPVMADYRPG
jgi:hypothetical protein